MTNMIIVGLLGPPYKLDPTKKGESLFPFYLQCRFCFANTKCKQTQNIFVIHQASETNAVHPTNDKKIYPIKTQYY